MQPADEGQAMSMESFKEQVLRVGQQASFAVQMKGKKGRISASVTSPSGAQIDCNVAELEEGTLLFVFRSEISALGVFFTYFLKYRLKKCDFI